MGVQTFALNLVQAIKRKNFVTPSLLLDVIITHIITFVLPSEGEKTAVLSDLGQSNSLVMLLNEPDPRRGQ